MSILSNVKQQHLEHPVTGRHVFYCMGYDPHGPAFYHGFFQHQFDIFCNRFGFVGSVTPSKNDDDGICAHWDLKLSDVQWEVHTRYTFFRWDDLVIRDLQRPLISTLWLKFLCDLDSVMTGTIFRLIWLNWRFGLACLYPTMAILGLILLGLILGGMGVAALQQANWPWWAACPVLPLLTGLVFLAGYRLLSKKCFLNLLVEDGIFSWQHARGERRDYLRRVDEFADRLVKAVRSSADDEIVVVGHSSGSFCAVEVLARACEKTRS